jgi:hypothetical protein
MSLPKIKQLMASSASIAPTNSAISPSTDDSRRQHHPGKPLMTRKQALAYLHSLGFPMAEAYFNKLCLPSRNSGPPVAKQWGPRPLYDADQVLSWIEARCRASQAA